MDKIKICISGLQFPVTMMRYFIEEFQQLPNVDLKIAGPFSGSWIPWNGGMTLPARYVMTPDIPLPANINRCDPAIVEAKLPWKPDLWIQFDAGFHFTRRPNATLVATVGTDPHCLPSNTYLATQYGVVTIGEIMEQDVPLVVCDKYGMSSSGGIHFSGYQPVIDIFLENGNILSCTDGHQIEVPGEVFVSASSLKIGDKIISSYGQYVPPKGNDKDYSMGFVVGAFQGDGSFGSSDILRFTFSKIKKQELKRELVRHLLNGFGIDKVTISTHSTCENAVNYQVRRYGFYRFLKNLELKSGKVPLWIRRGSRELIGGYLAGLFGADGHSNGGLINLLNKDEKLIREIQILLQYLGVPTRIKPFITNEGSYKPGLTYWHIFVNAGDGAKNFLDLVHYIPDKEVNPNSRAMMGGGNMEQEIEIVDIRGRVKNYPNKRCPVPVYDIVNTNSGTFLANGISVHNCDSDLHYDEARNYSDIFFNMQQSYLKTGDVYLPYAFSEKYHYPVVPSSKKYDGCLIGLQYTHRTALVKALRQEGYEIHYTIGEVFDEFRLSYNQSKIALNWSSLNDLNARTFEAFGMDIPLLTNRVSDLSNFFVEGDHYQGFSNVEEAVEKFKWMIEHPLEIDDMAGNAYRKVKAGHTYRDRVQQILEITKMI